MADNILESYFVKVAALPDAASFIRLGSLLKSTENEILGLTGTAVDSIIKFEAGSLAAFSAIGLGLIALADKTAMTDQTYRLMGLRMLMTKDSAQALSMALHQLGDVSMDEVAFDPELNRRFQTLYEQNMKLIKERDAAFSQNMILVRDLRMEYEKFGVRLQFLENDVVSKLFSKLGLGTGDLSTQLAKLNDWFEQKLPEWSDAISDDLVATWKDAVIVLEDFGNVAKEAAGDFQLLTGILTGDDSLTNTDVSLKSINRTMLDWLDTITKLTLSLEFLTKLGLHGLAATVSTIASARFALTGDFAEAKKYHAIADKEEGLAANDVGDMTSGVMSKLRGESDDNWENNPDYAGFKRYRDRKLTDSAMFDESDFGPAFDKNKLPTHQSGNVLPQPVLASLFKDAQFKTGVDAELLAAVMHQESGGNPTLTSPKGAQGLMQLLPSTAKGLGVTNSFDPTQNVMGGAQYLAQLLTKYQGDVKLALAAYNAGPAAVDKYHGIPPYKETQDYVARVTREYQSLRQKQNEQGGNVVVDTVTINVPHTLPSDQWADFIKSAFDQQTRKNTVNTTAQTAGGPFY